MAFVARQRHRRADAPWHRLLQRAVPAAPPADRRDAGAATAPGGVRAGVCPGLRRPDSAQASASSVRRFSRRLDLPAEVLEAVAVQVRRHEDLAAGDRAGTREGPRNGEAGPTPARRARAGRSRSPSPPAAAPASRPDRSRPGPSCRRGPRGPSGVIVRCIVAALAQQLAQRRHAAAVGRAADEVEAQVIRRVGEDLRVAVPAQAASPGCSARAR